MKFPLAARLHKAAESLPLNQRLVLTGVLVGMATGVGVYLFHGLLDACLTVREDLIAALPGWGGGLVTLLIPAAGGLTAGVIAHRWCAEAKGNGVERVIDAIRDRESHISGRVALFKSASSAATIGFGGSAGLEGPVVQIGASLGSWLGRFLDAPARDLPVFLAAGAVGGLSAAIGAPLAGVFFTMEVVLKDFANEAFPAVVVSSAVGAAVARSLLSGESLGVPVDYQWAGPTQLFLLGLLGLIAVPLGLFYTSSLERVEKFFETLPVPEWVKPGIGGAAVGLFTLAAPRVPGTGRLVIADALSGRFTGVAAGVYAALKSAATALTLGSGGSGGALMPALAVGAAAGSAAGHGAALLGIPVDTGAWAVVGMSSVFTVAFSAPATGIVLGLELTRDYGLLSPLMIACAVAHIASRRPKPVVAA